MEATDIGLRLFSVVKSCHFAVESLLRLSENEIHLIHCHSRTLKAHHEIVWEFYRKYSSYLSDLLNPEHDIVSMLTRFIKRDAILDKEYVKQIREAQDYFDATSDQIAELNEAIKNLIADFKLVRDPKRKFGRAAAMLGIKCRLMDKMMYDIHESLGLER